jgi:hypothetical protein
MSASVLQRLKRLGFDLSQRKPEGGWRVRCSQCEAVCVNGIPCHERGCPNARRSA